MIYLSDEYKSRKFWIKLDKTDYQPKIKREKHHFLLINLLLALLKNLSIYLVLTITHPNLIKEGINLTLY